MRIPSVDAIVGQAPKTQFEDLSVFSGNNFALHHVEGTSRYNHFKPSKFHTDGIYIQGNNKTQR